MTFITIGNRQIPVYSLIGITGIFLGIGVIYLICRKFKQDFQDTVTFFVLSFAGGLVCSKILYWIVSWRDIAADWDKITNNFSFFIEKYIYGGLVFYGALIGAVITAFLYCKFRKIRFNDIALPVITVIPLVHGIARIGCHVVGCCYGAPTSLPIGIVYHNSIAAPLNIPLMPVQLMESVCNLIIFTVLLIALKRKNTIFSLGLYTCLYAVVRFILEFFRGDIERGFVGVFSTSQFISIIIFIFGIFCFCIYHKNTKNAS